MMKSLSIKTKRDLAALLFPRPSKILDILNNNAKLNKWIRGNKSKVFENRFSLYEYIQENYIKSSKIQYLEFGVYRGESINKWVDINKNIESKFFGFDTFTGLPEEWGSYLEQGHFDTNGETPSINDSRVRFIKGLFQDSLPIFMNDYVSDGQLVIHNDSDLYSSTLYTLSTLNSYIPAGTIIIFDEFASPMHEFRAWNDYLSAFMRKATLIGSAGPYAEQAAFIFD
jgi:hypothetical protein